MASTLYRSLQLSVFVQILTGILELFLLRMKAPPSVLFLKQLLGLDVAVQFMEASFYLYWLFHFKTISNVTPTRYYDWMITTPTMLVTLIAYFMYLKHPHMTWDMLYQEWFPIGIVVVLNALMLWCGYLGEIGKMPVGQSVSLGFLPFVLYFYIIYDRYVTHDATLFYYFVGVWALYGGAAVMPYVWKNAAYNGLDLFSKNFFGLFLAFLIYTKN
jgi:hypothetical protein